MKGQKPLHLYKEEAKKKPQHLLKDYMIFEKYDGWYGYYINGHIYTFADRIIPSVQWLADILKAGMDNHGAADGRLVFEILLSDVTDFHTLNGILNRKYERAEQAYLRVHDYVPVSSIHRNSDRYSAACQIVSELELPQVRIAPLHAITSDISDWRHICEAIWEEGGEGIIAKQVDGLYKWGGRDASMLKIKLECTFEAVVVGMGAGKLGGKYAATLGYLIVQTKDGIQHNVSGMTDKQRNAWWSDEETVVGAIVECQAMQKLKDGTYREPRFKAVRHDKTIEDID